jgi:hypothetical protein
MAETFPYKIVIVSDLHLSEGWDENGYLQRNEDFFFDQNFKRFLEYLLKKGEEEGVLLQACNQRGLCRLPSIYDSTKAGRKNKGNTDEKGEKSWDGDKRGQDPLEVR